MTAEAIISASPVSAVFFKIAKHYSQMEKARPDRWPVSTMFPVIHHDTALQMFH